MQAQKLNRRIAEETRWLREGLTARRKRNMGRVKALMVNRRERAERIRPSGRMIVSVETAEGAGTAIIEANHIAKSYMIDLVRFQKATVVYRPRGMN